MSNFRRNYQIVTQSVCTLQISPRMQLLNALHFLQHMPLSVVFFCFFFFSPQLQQFLWMKKWDLIKISICISLVISDAVYIFISLLALLLLLLSRFSHVQLCVTPYTAAHQALQSLGFSWQEHWSGLPFPSPVHESEK